MKYSTFALFCDDIRDEASGVQSLMGIWPDYVNLETPEGGIATSRFAVYVRTFVPAGERPERVEVALHIGEDTVLPVAVLEPDFIAKTMEEAARGNVPNAGFINRVAAPAYPFPQQTLMKVVVRCGGEERIAGAVRVTPITSPNASQPPSEQFPPASPAS